MKQSSSELGTTAEATVNTKDNANINAEAPLVVALVGHASVAAMLVASAMLGWGNGQVIPNATAAGVNLFPKLAGTASASLGTAQMGMGAVASLLFGLMHNGTPTPMAALMAGMGLAAFVSCALIVAARRRPAAA